MVELDGLKFDPDAFSPGPPDLCTLNDNRHVVPREQQKIDSHTGDELNRVLNTTTISGKIHRPDNMRPVISHHGTWERGGESLIAALDHGPVEYCRCNAARCSAVSPYC